MWSYLDKTFCGSPHCTNECGRKMTPRQTEEASRHGFPVAYAYFCGDSSIEAAKSVIEKRKVSVQEKLDKTE